MTTDLIFFLIAVLGGAINAVAGGGSFLLFPVLMFGGMGAVAANVMCTIALWPGSVASSLAYWRGLKIPVDELRALLVFCIIGSGVGAWILLVTPEVMFKALVPWLMLAATLIFTFGRRFIAWRKMVAVSSRKSPIPAFAGMAIIALYGGYFGAGIGILMLALLQLLGHTHMHEMNGLKTILGSAINAVAMVIFVASGVVVWEWALPLIAGGVAGGYVGTKLALQISPERVRSCVIAVAWIMTAILFQL